MAIYTELKACFLYGKDWSWIKASGTRNDEQQDTVNLRERYEGSVEFNKCVAWVTEKIDSVHFTSKHTYSVGKCFNCDTG